MKSIASRLRPQKRNPFRRVFFIVTEGRVTEGEYFAMFRPWAQIVTLSAGNATSPMGILNLMQHEYNKFGFKSGDEAWIVIDRETEASRKSEEFVPIIEWATHPQGTVHRGVAISNPKFELWLVLHFDNIEAGQVITNKLCDGMIGSYIHGYNKHLNEITFSESQIKLAIERAKHLSYDVLNHSGTTVAELCERIISIDYVSTERNSEEDT